MSKSLIITEKPSVAVEFAKVLQVGGRKDGYIENDQYVITWCVGHLVGMVYPESYDEKYKKWKLEDLPFLPTEYKYDVIKNVEKQYQIVHNMLHREDIDCVYWAGDAGKEGQTIEENIRNFGGVRQGMRELRVWIDSQTEEEILRGIREAKPMSDYANLGKSGIMRTIEDYAMGINFSRVMSVKYGNLLNDAAGTSSYTAIAVGRVMTCVLGMVVIREREIRNFKETPFYRVIGKFTDASIPAEWRAVEGSGYYESPLLYKENGFKEEKDALALIDKVKDSSCKVLSIEKGTTKKRAPLLFNLAELQAECSKRFKISPDETLQVAQDLYEKKLTTYPRTDARVLSTAVAKEIYKNISRLKGFEPTEKHVEYIMSNKLYANIANTSYTDDSKVTDHYAIIPTGQITELGTLNSLQKNVYELIVRRFLSIFYPPAEYENVKLTVGVLEEQFFASAKVLKKPGYLEVTQPPAKKSFEESNARILGTNAKENGEEEEDTVIDPKVLLKLADSLKVGDEIECFGYEIKYGKTSPPKRYTSGSMVLAMENAGQLIEDEELREQIKGSGIGTSATRAEIIKKLVRIHYLNLNSKTQILTPENLGEMVYEVVFMTVPELLNPKMTASWEKGLDGITRGTVDFSDYRNKLEDYIRRETTKMIGQNLRTEIADRISDFAGKNARGAGARRKIGAKCPLCGGEIVTTTFGYGCTNYKQDKSGCNFNIGEIAGKSIPEEQVKLLLESGKTEVISGFKSKQNKKFEAKLKLEKDEEEKIHIVFDFEDIAPEILEDVKCPACSANLVKTSFGYRCENYKSDKTGCYFSVGEKGGKTITGEQLTQLIRDGHTDTIRGFKSQKGKKFDACLKLEKDEEGRYIISFDFENVEQKKVKDVSCPCCGGDIVVTSFGYGCANYKSGEEDGCRFSIGKLADKTLTEANVKELLSNGITGTIRGFKSPKTGKKFDARVALNKDENGKVTGLKFDFNDLEPQKLKDVTCPVCKGDIIVTPFGYRCSNYSKEEEKGCTFQIGTIASVKLKDAQVKELLTTGKTGVISGFVAKTGMKFDAPLKLTEDGQVQFDFPEKPKPVESTLECPKCKKLLKKGQWQYECECGYKVWHTVAKVPLTEEVMRELFATGKTKAKITGFTSKTGNVFSACLKYENDQILFDFDNPGIEETEEQKEKEDEVHE